MRHPSFHIHSYRQFNLTQWPRWPIPVPYWRLYYHNRGGACIYFKDKIIQLLPSKYYLISPNTPFTSELRHPLEHFCVYFSVTGIFKDLELGIYEFPMEARMQSKLVSIKSFRESNSIKTKLQLLAILHEAILNVPDFSENPPDDHDNPSIFSVLELVENEKALDMSNLALAKIAGMHVDAFVRKFTKTIGQSPQMLIRKEKIRRACILLHFTRDPIEEIARQLHFCDRYHFSRVFKKERGVSPAKFRASLDG
ncbi:MAG: AraC family transcriptional regulator [Verrucomicrobiota bacterium]